MKKMMDLLYISTLILTIGIFAQEKIDISTMEKITGEGLNRSQLIDMILK